MPSDDDSKTQASSEKGKGESQGLATKAVATVFATVVAPVLIALGMKFSDVIVANFQPKPAPEAAKAEPEKSTAAKAEPAKSESTAARPAKTSRRVDPATPPAAEKKPDSSARRRTVNSPNIKVSSPNGERKGKRISQPASRLQPPRRPPLDSSRCSPDAI